jgi:Ran GTPase-activating protein (RanGAP) involved in mRNA processing and transport
MVSALSQNFPIHPPTNIEALQRIISKSHSQMTRRHPPNAPSNSPDYNPKYPLTLAELKTIFLAKCEDNQSSFTDDSFSRFLRNQTRNPMEKTFSMESSMLGPSAADQLARILFNHPYFRVISLRGNLIGDYGAASIAHVVLTHPSLISLDLSDNSIGDLGVCAIFQAMQHSNTLVHLKIGSTGRSSRNELGQYAVMGLRETLEQNEVLSSLSVRMTGLTEERIVTLGEGLRANRTLQAIDLGNNAIKTKGAASLLGYLIEGNLRELRLGGNGITDDFAPHLVHFLKVNQSLRVLDLSGNSFTQKFLGSICEAVMDNTVLREFNISKNPLGSRGLKYLGAVLASNQTLKKLDISGCKIYESGFQEFCAEVPKNDVLESFICQHNPMHDGGAGVLADAIRGWAALREIDLELCDIGDDGAIAVMAAIEVSPTLRSVSLKTNMIRNASPIIQCLSNNARIIECVVDWNDIDIKSLGAIQKLVASNVRRWKGEQKKCTPEEEMEMEARNRNLEVTREQVIDTRKQIAVLIQNLVEINQNFAAAQQARDTRIGHLESQFEALEAEALRQTDEMRARHEEGRKANAAVEREIGRLSTELSAGKDQEGYAIKRLELATAEYLQAKKPIDETFHNLDWELESAKQRYRNLKALLIDSWNQRKMDAEEALRRKEEEAKRAAKPRAPKRRGKQSKIPPKTITPEPVPKSPRIEQNGPVLVKSPRVPQNGPVSDLAMKPPQIEQNGSTPSGIAPAPAALHIEPSASFSARSVDDG